LDTFNGPNKVVLKGIGIVKLYFAVETMGLFSTYKHSHTLTNQNPKPHLNALNEHTNYLSVFYYQIDKT
jgi:hypothetical protein